MLFYTKSFLIFWIISFTIHSILQRKTKAWQGALLVASCVFYAQWEAKFLILMSLVAISDFILGILIEDAKSERFKKTLMIFSVSVNLGVLGVFKYYDFFVSEFSNLLSLLFGINPNINLLNLVLPIGISFFTFESLSYIIEVYRGHMKASRNFIEYFLFIAFFPHLVAGPIIQPKLLIEQFRMGPQISFEKINYGLWRFAIGVAKKLLIADQLAFYAVDPVFKHTELFGGIDILIGCICYSLQIYFDFSGYSDMALGLANVYGFNLPENFNFPYLATTIRDFWKRWHISLSTWLRDYLYFSLGGNKGNTFFKYRNIFLTMLLGGIWHGASVNFIVWGTLHGIYIIMSHFLNDSFSIDNKLKDKFKVARMCFVFALVTFAWIFFRAETTSGAINIIVGIFQRFDQLTFALETEVYILIVVSFIYFVFAQFDGFKKIGEKFRKNNSDLLVAGTIAFIVVLVMIFSKQYSPFIYFQF